MTRVLNDFAFQEIETELFKLKAEHQLNAAKCKQIAKNSQILASQGYLKYTGME